MQGVLGKLGTSAPSKSDLINTVLLFLHSSPASFRIKFLNTLNMHEARELNKHSKTVTSAAHLSRISSKAGI